jgi:shikimate kinase/3-dehydroquinate synthase
MPATDQGHLIITGFMGTGKTTIGRLVAQRLGRPFVDTDALIEARAGRSIARIFAEQGEAAFRQIEADLCRELSAQAGLVIATGGGMLIAPANRQLMESCGRIVCLTASPEAIIQRIAHVGNRPLLAEPDPLAAARRILAQRAPVYDSFEWQVDTTNLNAEAVADEVLRLWRARRLTLHGPAGAYPLLIREGALAHLGEFLARLGRQGTVAVVSNPTVWDLYGAQATAGLQRAGFLVAPCQMPDGEEFKTLATVASLYEQFLDAGLERSGTVLALGGGVVGDVAGFAAATYLRGVPVVQAPTTLLAMIDSSAGGKTGVDLPRGKNLVGAFHHPIGVVIDPDALATLPAVQTRCGLAEALKAGLIGDPALFELLRAGPPWPWIELIERSLAVKIAVVEEDPDERGRRAVLNLGHTAAHALERLSNYRLPHGEAVAVGLVVAARISAGLGRCAASLPDEIAAALRRLGLPTAWSGPHAPAEVLAAMATDKKRRGGRLRWVLPARVGEVFIADDVPDAVVLDALTATRA